MNVKLTKRVSSWRSCRFPHTPCETHLECTQCWHVQKLLSIGPSLAEMWQKSLAENLKSKQTFIFRTPNPCLNSAFSGSSATTTASTAKSQPAAVRVGASHHQLAAGAVHHLPDAPGPAGWAPPWASRGQCCPLSGAQILALTFALKLSWLNLILNYQYSC